MTRKIPPAIAPAIIAMDPLVGDALPDSFPCLGKCPAIVGWSVGRNDIVGGDGILVMGGCQLLSFVVTSGDCIVVVVIAVVVVVVEYTKVNNTGL